MKEIILEINNPAWWFTAVFVAVLVSTIGGVLSHALILWGAGKIDKYKGWKKQKEESDKKWFMSLVDNEGLLFAEGFKLVLNWLVFLTAFIIFFVGMTSYALVEYKDAQQHVLLLESSPESESWFLYAYLSFMALMAIISIVQGWFVGNRTKKFFHVLRVFRMLNIPPEKREK